MKALIIAVVVFLALIFGIGGSMVSVYNTNVHHETNILKFDKDSQNVLSAYTNKIRDMAQIPDMYRDDLSKVIEATFNGRYGADGSKAVFSMIKESNMSLEPSMYTNIQAAMEAGRNEFKQSQTKKLDACAGYRNQLNFAMSGMISRVVGFPKIDIEKTCRVVLDKETNTAFETGETSTIKLR